MVLSSMMLLVKTLVLVLLGLASRTIPFVYLGADMGMYLLYKICRGDFLYWLPLDGYMGVAVSLLCRVIVKVIVDFTSNGECK